MGNNILKNYKIYGLIIESLSLTIKDILIIIWNHQKNMKNNVSMENPI